MIEWVNIDKFEANYMEEILVCYLTERGDMSVANTLHLGKSGPAERTYGKQRVIYGAKINFPVEKTLEEKFIDHYESMNGKEYTVGSMIKCLSEIAKEHYEVEK